MERGLMWLPLLGLFIWLAWAGWNEYQKVEAYKTWAADFERAKYDIYAVLGQKADQLTWGSPTRKGPVDLRTVSLNEAQSISLTIDGREFPMQVASRLTGESGKRDQRDQRNQGNQGSQGDQGGGIGERLDDRLNLPTQGRKVAIALHLANETITIPFTDAELAGKWAQQLEQLRQTYQQT